MSDYTEARILSYFEAHIQARGECWIWTGATSPGNPHPYGDIYLGRRKRAKAHRWSYEYHVADIPDGLEIDHLCRQTLCVNPSHLEPVTHAENMLRGEPAQRTRCPQGHPYDEQNTYWRPASAQGRRDCRECKRASARRWKAKQPPIRSDFCKNGHPLSGENLAEKNGSRSCRKCKSAAAMKANQSRWGNPR